ncbi:MAG: hypothetical protein MUF30_05115, partial [Burkholderiales bacterium]|nr:hypothetical protein [Burkholderiales bacterium]
MSLLLQALQKAARTREAGGAEPAADPTTPAPAAPSPPPAPAGSGMLELEPGDFDLAPVTPSAPPRRDAEPVARPTPSTPRAPASPPAPELDAPSPRQAASVLAAGASAPRVAGRSAATADWVREHPVHVFAGVAFAFLLLYGGYVWMEVTHPGMLRGGSW